MPTPAVLSSPLSAALASAPLSARACAAPASDDLGARLSRLTGLAQHSAFLFASPLGPFTTAGRTLAVPRFVYFGPQTSDESLRLACFAGYDHAAPGPALALAHFVERLALAPELGAGLNLSFFPQVDVLGGVVEAGPRALAARSWLEVDPVADPELALLAQDVRHRALHGFVQLVATDAEALTLSLAGHPATLLDATGVELVSSAEAGPFDVRFEAAPHDTPVTAGPLTLAEDLPYAPFELTLGLPQSWSEELQREAAATFLKHFILRYRATLAYAQHL